MKKEINLFDEPKMTLKEFKQMYMSNSSKWDFNTFSIVCNKCKSKKIEFNGWFESEEGYYGSSSLEGGIIVKCHSCGNAFKINTYDADELNINAKERFDDVSVELQKVQNEKRNIN